MFEGYDDLMAQSWKEILSREVLTGRKSYQ